MAESETKEAGATVTSDSNPSPSSSEKSGSSGGSVNRFYSISKSIQKNIETLNYVTKEIEKINDRFLFQSSSITPSEESTLLNKVSMLHKDTSMKARDTERMIKNMRAESKKPTPTPGSVNKAKGEKTPEELEAERQDLR